MKQILLVAALLFTLILPASSDNLPDITLVHGILIVEKPLDNNCEVEGYKISCVYLLALYNKIKEEETKKRYQKDKWI